MVVMLLPGIGLLSWRTFEQNLGWSNFFIIATSLSLSGALVQQRGGGVVCRNAGFPRSAASETRHGCCSWRCRERRRRCGS